MFRLLPWASISTTSAAIDPGRLSPQVNCGRNENARVPATSVDPNIVLSCDLENVINGLPTLLPSFRCNVTRSMNTFTGPVCTITRSNPVVKNGPRAHAVVTTANGSV